MVKANSSSVRPVSNFSASSAFSAPFRMVQRSNTMPEGIPVGVGYQPDGGVLFQLESGIACGGGDVHPVHIHERAGDVQRIGVRRILFPLGVNRGVALDGLGKVKLCGVGIVGIPAIKCITLCRQRSGVGGGSVKLNILAGRVRRRAR